MSLFPRMPMSAFAHPPHRHDFAPFYNLFNDLQRMTDAVASTVNKSTFTPKFDVSENDDAYMLEGEMPGIERRDIEIEFTDDQTLTIRGRTEKVREEGRKPGGSAGAAAGTVVSDVAGDEVGEKDSSDDTSNANAIATTATANTSKEVSRPAPPQNTYWLSERSVGEFARSFGFPNRVDQNNVKASLKNGILSVVLPKLKVREREARRIAIE